MSSERAVEPEVIGGGLDFGITAYHIRILVENPWNGGGGYTLEQVAEMTPDQVYFRLCDKGIFAGKPGSRTARTTPHSMAEKNDGTALVRCEDGTLKRMRYGGKSRARQLMEEAEARRKAAGALQPDTRKGRRERRAEEQRKAREEAERAKHRDRRRK